MKDLCPAELATMKMAQGIIDARPEWLALDEQWAPGALLDALDAVIIPALEKIQAVGNGWRIMQLEMLKTKLEKMLARVNRL